VTKHIAEIVKFIQRLIDSKQAYIVKSGSVYFDTQKFRIRSFHNQVETDLEIDSKGKTFTIFI
jgi:cysteinyl-tRNA synthetase